MPGADQSPQSNAQPGQFVGKFFKHRVSYQSICTDSHFLIISDALLDKLVQIVWNKIREHTKLIKLNSKYDLVFRNAEWRTQ